MMSVARCFETSVHLMSMIVASRFSTAMVSRLLLMAFTTAIGSVRLTVMVISSSPPK